MKQNINEHDMTKRMMDVLRGGYKSLIKEADEPTPNDMVPVDELTPVNDDQKDTLDVKPKDNIWGQELKKLQALNPRVEITNFKIYPDTANVILEGVFLKEQDENSGVKFKMELTAGDIEISAENIDLTDEVTDLVKKMKGYYKNWTDEWSLKMANEYKPENEK